MSEYKTVGAFMEKHFKHFNARETLDAAKGWRNLLENGGRMFLSMAGAMSTCELGISLAEMIRRDKVHGISCTAANLEEDIFNLFNNKDYKVVPQYRDLTPRRELELRESGFNRVTDTCIPETVMQEVEKHLVQFWKQAAAAGESKFPYEYIYELLDAPGIEEFFQIPREHSWVAAAKDKNIPIFSPGYEDSSLGNKFTALVMEGELPHHNVLRTGTEQMQFLAEWYLGHAEQEIPMGFFQIGGGIAGDFAICVVPLLIQDLNIPNTPLWQYFAQIGDSTTSYGSYSGAVPNEKITWYKLAPHTPSFMINSDASIVAPLIFAYVLGE